MAAQSEFEEPMFDSVTANIRAQAFEFQLAGFAASAVVERRRSNRGLAGHRLPSADRAGRAHGWRVAGGEHWRSSRSVVTTRTVDIEMGCASGWGAARQRARRDASSTRRPSRANVSSWARVAAKPLGSRWLAAARACSSMVRNVWQLARSAARGRRRTWAVRVARV